MCVRSLDMSKKESESFGSLRSIGNNDHVKGQVLSIGRWLARLVVLTTIMYVIGTDTLSPRVTEDSVSLLFMPVALLAFLFYICRTWSDGILYTLALSLSIMIAVAIDGGSVPATMPYVMVDLVEAAAIAICLRWTTSRSLFLRRPWRVTFFLAIILSVTAVSAMLAAGYSTIAAESADLSSSTFWTFWRDWYLGDVTAYLTVMAILLMGRRFWWRRAANTIRRRPVEYGSSLLFLIAAVLYDFEVVPAVEFLVLSTHMTEGAPHPALLFMTFPAVVWLSYRFRQLGAATGILFTSVPTIHLVAMGFGPQWLADVGERAVIMQAYIGISAIAAFYVGALAFQVRHREFLLKRAFNHAQRRARDRADFLTVMNHEIRTPLNAIIGYSELMGSEVAGELPPRYRSFVDAIDQSSKRLLHLVNEVMDLTRISSGSFSMEKETLLPGRETDEILSMLAGVAERAEVRMVNAIPDDLTLSANRISLRHALTNVISNALRHTPSGGLIKVAAHVRGTHVHLAVSDTGEGFDVGSVLDSKTLARDDKRAGFGLQITDTIMSLHDGRMLIDSRIGKGTTVVLVFPQQAAPGTSAEGVLPD